MQQGNRVDNATFQTLDLSHGFVELRLEVAGVRAVIARQHVVVVIKHLFELFGKGLGHQGIT